MPVSSAPTGTPLLRQVGERGEEGVHALEQRRQRLLAGLELVADLGDLGHHARGVLALALEHADLLGERVAAGLQLLGTGLQLLALVLEGLEGGGVELRPARGEASGDVVELGAEKLDIEHRKPS